MICDDSHPGIGGRGPALPFLCINLKQCQNPISKAMDSLFDDTPGSPVEGGSSRQDLPLARLKLHWQAEKASPELLAYQGDLVDALRNETEDLVSQ